MQPKEPLFLDTTIQVARIFKGIDASEMERFDSLLSQHAPLSVCTFSQLEYKRVVLQNLALTLRYLVDSGSFFYALHESTALIDRKCKACVNILSWVGDQIKDVPIKNNDTVDLYLSQRAAAYIRANIVYLWHRFRAGMQVADQTKCQRAMEKPIRRDDGSFDVTVHESYCRQKQCSNALFFQSRLPQIKHLCETLEGIKANGGTLTDELEKALTTMRLAIKNRQILYDYQTCLKIGDVWIHLEALAAGIRHFATTNYKESTVLCPAFGLVMHNPSRVVPVVKPPQF